MTTKKKERGTHTRGGFLPEDHWLYSSGPIVAGRPIVPPLKKGRHTNLGLLPPDDPIYTTGPIVNGRKILKPYRKMTPEEVEKLLADARAIARGNPKPSENN